MFTGIVRALGRVEAFDGSRLVVAAPETAATAAVGDSVAVAGVCLTVVANEDGRLSFEAVPETLSRTALGSLRPGSAVNVEPSLRVGDPLGGHVVQGHVDAVATITEIKPDGASLRYTFQFPQEAEHQMPFLVEKGFVTVDGASLTLTHVDDATRSFGIMLIAHSQSKLTLTNKKVGDPVNIEVDCAGKYILGSESRIAALVERVVDRRLKELGVLKQ
jgi:riboflavin synthase